MRRLNPVNSRKPKSYDKVILSKYYYMYRKTKENLVELIKANEFDLVEQLLKGLDVEYTTFCIRELDKMKLAYNGRLSLEELTYFMRRIWNLKNTGPKPLNKYEKFTKVLTDQYVARLKKINIKTRWKK